MRFLAKRNRCAKTWHNERPEKLMTGDKGPYELS